MDIRILNSPPTILNTFIGGEAKYEFHQFQSFIQNGKGNGPNSWSPTGECPVNVYEFSSTAETEPTLTLLTGLNTPIISSQLVGVTPSDNTKH